MQHVEITISGKVQGVFYRVSAKEAADKIGVRGFVCNLANGNVYAEAEGDNDQLTAFTEWCKQGPSRAVVDNIAVVHGIAKGYTGFEIRR